VPGVVGSWTGVAARVFHGREPLPWTATMGARSSHRRLYSTSRLPNSRGVQQSRSEWTNTSETDTEERW